MKQVLPDIIEQLLVLYPKDEARNMAYLLLGEVLSVPKYRLLADKDKQLSELQKKQLQEMVQRLLQHEPIQYLIGYTDFYDLRLRVTPQVLVPRPETEELVEWVLTHAQQQPVRSLLDIGTGSGCIALSLAKHLPQTRVYGMDVSEGALEVAQENGTLNGVSVHWLQADILANLPADFPQGLDVLVSNPPYITQDEASTMSKHVVDHEPSLALFVPIDNKLLFYERIAELAKQLLVPDGSLFFEVHRLYGQEVVEMLKMKGFKEVELRKDMAGNDRMIKAVV